MFKVPGASLFTLEIGNAGYCMALPDFSGGYNEPVILQPCSTGDELQYWTLG